MRTSLIIPMSIMMAMLAVPAASAWSLDETTGTSRDGTSKFTDPDDKIPFPHADDNGQVNQLQAQPAGSPSLSLQFNGSHDDSDAFTRAQQRMMQ